jgi:hypothetical protein
MKSRASRWTQPATLTWWATLSRLDFPTSGSRVSGNDFSAFVAKLNATGTSLIYVTQLGRKKEDSGEAIAVDSAGNAYVTGETTSNDFPVFNAFDPNFNACLTPLDPFCAAVDAFVTKLNSSGECWPTRPISTVMRRTSASELRWTRLVGLM